MMKKISQTIVIKVHHATLKTKEFLLRHTLYIAHSVQHKSRLTASKQWQATVVIVAVKLQQAG